MTPLSCTGYWMLCFLKQRSGAEAPQSALKGQQFNLTLSKINIARV
jgi:hypothetical protein